MRILVVLAVAGYVLVTHSLPAAAQQAPRTCPEGRTASGQCVNPSLAQDMRTGGIVYSQPKISLTNPPLLPDQDGQYTVIRDSREVRNLHGRPLINSAGGETRQVNIGTITTPIFVNVPIGPRP